MSTARLLLGCSKTEKFSTSTSLSTGAIRLLQTVLVGRTYSIKLNAERDQARRLSASRCMHADTMDALKLMAVHTKSLNLQAVSYFVGVF